LIGLLDTKHIIRDNWLCQKYLKIKKYGYFQ
jgi:hypothetical protein